MVGIDSGLRFKCTTCQRRCKAGCHMPQSPSIRSKPLRHQLAAMIQVLVMTRITRQTTPTHPNPVARSSRTKPGAAAARGAGARQSNRRHKQWRSTTKGCRKVETGPQCGALTFCTTSLFARLAFLRSSAALRCVAAALRLSLAAATASFLWSRNCCGWRDDD